MISRWESRAYRNVGIKVLISIIALLIIPLGIGNKIDENRNCQAYSIKGIDVKENTLAFRQFLFDIKKQNGVLVLGSSETAAFGRENYHGLLNKYFDCGHDFSVLSGAGRTAHIYYPSILKNEDLFEGMNVLYFINPTYWRIGLNEFHKEYYERYVDPYVLYSVKNELIQFGLYEECGADFLRSQKENRLELFSGMVLSNWRKPYINILKNLKEGNSTNNASCARGGDLKSIDSVAIKALNNDLNLEKNISKDFMKRDPKKFVKLKKSDFQWKALKGLIEIGEKRGVNITYVIGPYNGVYCDYYSPELKSEHDELIQSLKKLLEERKTNFIDCSDLSYQTGTFIDVQHHSKYAAWIIADRIAKYYEKTD